MMLLNVDFHSDALEHATRVTVLLPQNAATQIGMDSSDAPTCRTLLLLHGLSDDNTIWQRRTSIERYVSERNMAVIMPDAGRSWYTDTARGERYAEHIYNEVPSVCRAAFRQLTDRREDNFIAGLSMGGYGALKGALLYPERYAACACFSSCVDFAGRIDDPRSEGFFANIFGSEAEFRGSDNDVISLIPQVAKRADNLPAAYVSCGTEDFLLRDSRLMRDLLTENGYRVEYSESPGRHNWEFWDAEIQKALDFFDKI